MGSIRSKKGKGGYATYRTGGRMERNKESRNQRIQNDINKRKEWRIRKYGQTPQAQLSGTTIDLFRKWGIPLIGEKKERKRYENNRPARPPRKWQNNQGPRTATNVPQHGTSK